MKARVASACLRITSLFVLAAGALSARPAQALGLLDEQLSLDGHRRTDLVVALAATSPKETDPSLDFDLLGKPPPTIPSPDDATLKRRRSMLDLHQGLGLGLLGLQLATTVVGQLNYNDKYSANAPVTARYQLTHKALAYSTLGVFAVNGTIALLAPRAPGKTSRGFDRVTIHKLAMATAAAGMLAQGVLGYYTHQREGYLDQPSYARTHLAIGYATLAAVGIGVGVLVF